MTKRDEFALSPAQEIAVTALVRGASITDAASEAGVARQTLSTWKNHDPDFIAALNSARRDVWDHAEDRMRMLLTKALDRIDSGLESDGSAGVALDLLKSLGRLDIVPKGSTSAAQIRSNHKLNDLAAEML